jgi:hypothetical protein
MRRLRKLVCDAGHPRLGEQQKRGWPGRCPAMTKVQIIFHVVRKSLKMLEAFSGRP